MADADHRPVSEIPACIGSNAGRLAIKVVQQLPFLGDDPCMVPLIGFNLHDDHAAGRRVAFDKPFPLPVVEIEVVRVLAFPPGVIDAEIIKRNALGRMPVHYQAPAVVRAEDKRAANQRDGIRHYLGVLVAVRSVDTPDDAGLVTLLAIQSGWYGPGTIARVRMDDADDRAGILGIRPVLAVDAEMLCRVFVAVQYRDVALAATRLDNEATALARRLLQCMRPDGRHYRFVHGETLSGNQNRAGVAAEVEDCSIGLCQSGTKALAAVAQAASAYIQGRV